MYDIETLSLAFNKRLSNRIKVNNHENVGINAATVHYALLLMSTYI